MTSLVSRINGTLRVRGRFLVRCNKCGIEYMTSLWTKGDIHNKGECGGEFIRVEEDNHAS